MAILSNLGRYRNTGLLILRIGIGTMFILHGYPKLVNGPEGWANVGKAMQHIGIDFFHPLWGFLAGAAETFGGFLLILGLAFRPVCLALTFTMIIAAINHISGGDGISGASHAIEAAILFFSLILIGPGKYSVDKK